MKTRFEDDTAMKCNINANEEHVNPDEMFLNPEYIERMNANSVADELNACCNGIPAWMNEMIEHNQDIFNRDQNKMLEWIQKCLKDPSNSQIFRDQVMFKNASDVDDWSSLEDESSSVDEFKINIPLFHTTF